MLKETQFSLEALEGERFKGLSDGEEWNGFARPYFTFDQAKNVVEAWNSKGWEAKYDEEQDAFSFDVGHNLEDNEPTDVDTFFAEQIDNKKVYPIGAGCWIWTEEEGS